MLSLIYWKSFESLFGPVMAEADMTGLRRAAADPAGIAPKRWLGCGSTGRAP